MQTFLSLTFIAVSALFGATGTLAAMLFSAHRKGQTSNEQTDQVVQRWQGRYLAPALVAGAALGWGIDSCTQAYRDAARPSAPPPTCAAAAQTPAPCAPAPR